SFTLPAAGGRMGRPGRGPTLRFYRLPEAARQNSSAQPACRRATIASYSSVAQHAAHDLAQIARQRALSSQASDGCSCGIASYRLQPPPAIEHGGQACSDLRIECVQFAQAFGEVTIPGAVGAMEAAGIAARPATEQCVDAVGVLQRECGVVGQCLDALKRRIA